MYKNNTENYTIEVLDSINIYCYVDRLLLPINALNYFFQVIGKCIIGLKYGWNEIFIIVITNQAITIIIIDSNMFLYLKNTYEFLLKL